MTVGSSSLRDNKTLDKTATRGGGLECNMTRRYPFFTNLRNLFRKKFAFHYPVSELLSD